MTTDVDVEGKRLTVLEKGADKDTVVTTTDETEIVSGKDEEVRKVDPEKLARTTSLIEDLS